MGHPTDATIDRLQNYAGVTSYSPIYWDLLQNMKSSFLVSLFHVASIKDNMYHYPYCYPTDSDSWCKCNADRANNTWTYKPGPGLPKKTL